MNVFRTSAMNGSVLLHGGIVLIFLGVSILCVEALPEPASKRPAPVSIIVEPAAPAAAPPSGRPAAAGSTPSRETRRVHEVVAAAALHAPEEPVQPADSPVGQIDAGGMGAEDADGDPGGQGQGAEGGLPGGEGELGAGPGLGGWSHDDTPVYLTGEVRPPERTTFVKPQYPELARKVRAEGKVILEIVIGREGEVESVKILRSEPLFDQAAIEAVRMWKYQPALQSGRPVRVYLTVIVEFGLK